MIVSSPLATHSQSKTEEMNASHPTEGQPMKQKIQPQSWIYGPNTAGLRWTFLAARDSETESSQEM